MSLTAAVGQAQSLDGREAGAQAARLALSQLEQRPIALAFIFAAHEFSSPQVLDGVNAILGNIPALGFSTPGEIGSEGIGQRSVVVALLAGSAVQAAATWWPQDMLRNHAIADRLEELINGLPNQKTSLAGCLLVADGLDGDGERLCADLVGAPAPLAGCLAGGDLQLDHTVQIGGGQAGSGGLAAAVLSGEVRVGIGVDHGWHPVGVYCQVTRAQGLWVRALDRRPASETYARLFGFQPRDWAFPPLNRLVRIYPLGLEGDEETLLIRAPIRVEADGSLRMGSAIPEGSTGHMLVGSAKVCVEAARRAAQQALANLGPARPVLGLVLADMSWGSLLAAQGGREIGAIRTVIGPDVPLAGGYTLGQMALRSPSKRVDLLNQHIEVVLIGAMAE